jgi:hypothetical protein
MKTSNSFAGDAAGNQRSRRNGVGGAGRRWSRASGSRMKLRTRRRLERRKNMTGRVQADRRRDGRAGRSRRDRSHPPPGRFREGMSERGRNKFSNDAAGVCLTVQGLALRDAVMLASRAARVPPRPVAREDGDGKDTWPVWRKMEARYVEKQTGSASRCLEALPFQWSRASR